MLLLRKRSTPPVRALFVYNSNPAAVAPDSNAVLRGLSRPDLFTVVHEQFFTDTADYADILLPATTFLEHTDFQGAYGHYYLQLSDRAIEPLGEARPNVWVFSQLAQHMGFEEPCFRDTEAELIDQALSGIDPSHIQMQGITAGELGRAKRIRLRWPEEHAVQPRPFQPFAEGGFTTPSGKAEFWSQTLADRGLDPLPSFTPPQESRNTANPDERYPLEFLSRKADNYMNSTFANLPRHQRMEDANMNRLELHPGDAALRGIADGDPVEVFNDRGRIRLTAEVSTAVAPGVVAARLNWHKLSPVGSNSNFLTSQRLTDLGGGATFYSVVVEVRKAQAPSTNSSTIH